VAAEVFSRRRVGPCPQFFKREGFCTLANQFTPDIFP